MTEWNLCGSYNLIGNSEIKFKAWVDHSIKNTNFRKNQKPAKHKILKNQLKKRVKIAAKNISGVSKYETVK